MLGGTNRVNNVFQNNLVRREAEKSVYNLSSLVE
nr:MAG TPA: hypothetical protein [Caudoviricetes sp.]